MQSQAWHGAAFACKACGKGAACTLERKHGPGPGDHSCSQHHDAPGKHRAASLVFLARMLLRKLIHHHQGAGGGRATGER